MAKDKTVKVKVLKKFYRGSVTNEINIGEEIELGLKEVETLLKMKAVKVIGKAPKELELPKEESVAKETPKEESVEEETSKEEPVVEDDDEEFEDEDVAEGASYDEILAAYKEWTNNELREEIQNRGLDLPAKQNKENLAKVLADDDFDSTEDE